MITTSIFYAGTEHEVLVIEIASNDRSAMTWADWDIHGTEPHGLLSHSDRQLSSSVPLTTLAMP